MKNVFSVLFFLTSLITAYAQNDEFAVGYMSIVTHDLLRQENSPNNFLNNSNPENRFRPLLIHIWYPAERDELLSAMSHRDYHFIVEEFLQQETLSEEQKNQQQRALLSRFSKNQPNIESLFKQKSLARKDAKPLKGVFSLMLHSGHVKAQWEYNEAMARNGFIVLSVDALEMPYNELSYVNDLLFGLRYIKDHTSFKYNKVLGVGSGYGGSNIFSLQITNFILDGMISFGGTEYWIGKTDSFKGFFPQYSVKRINIPYVRLYSENEATEDTTFNTTYKYSDKHLLAIKDDRINHGTLQYPHSINKYNSDELTQLSDDLLQLKVNITLSFIKYLSDKKNEIDPVEFQNDFEIDKNYIPALPSPPSNSELVLLMRELDQEKLEGLIQTNLSEDPDFVDYDILFQLGRNLTWTGEVEKGIPYLELANSFFPREITAYIELLKASFWLKEKDLNRKYLHIFQDAVKNKKIKSSIQLDDLIEKYTL